MHSLLAADLARTLHRDRLDAGARRLAATAVPVADCGCLVAARSSDDQARPRIERACQPEVIAA
jgi:hypothetical protein